MQEHANARATTEDKEKAGADASAFLRLKICVERWPATGPQLTRCGSFFIAEYKQKGGERMAWKPYNPNPDGNRVGDCTVRALCKATGKDWEPIFCGLALEAFMYHNMPSANHVWGAYLRRHGFERHVIPNECPDCYTVADFCRDHPNGLFVLSISGHVVTVMDGDWFDTWDSGREIPVYYWTREEM